MNLCALSVLSGFLPASCAGSFALLAAAPHPLVHINAALNLTATMLLLVGLYLIKSGREAAHKQAMLLAFAVSTAFLVCYLWYHANVGSVKFTHTGPVRTVYLAILASHIVLAAAVPFLAILTIFWGLRAFGSGPPEVELRYRRRHRVLARWTFPIWLYVSVTGVVVYIMLYHLYPPPLG